MTFSNHAVRGISHDGSMGLVYLCTFYQKKSSKCREIYSISYMDGMGICGFKWHVSNSPTSKIFEMLEIPENIQHTFS